MHLYFSVKGQYRQKILVACKFMYETMSRFIRALKLKTKKIANRKLKYD